MRIDSEKKRWEEKLRSRFSVLMIITLSILFILAIIKYIDSKESISLTKPVSSAVDNNDFVLQNIYLELSNSNICTTINNWVL